jgi:putative ABC transport system ATP-binding protein
LEDTLGGKERVTCPHRIKDHGTSTSGEETHTCVLYGHSQFRKECTDEEYIKCDQKQEKWNVFLEKVERIYEMGDQRIQALMDLTLKLESGKLVIVLGPSGSGKTTLLNVLGGIDKCTSGKIIVGNHEITKMRRGKLARYRRHEVGFIFQFFNLLPIYTALENVQYAVELSLSKKKKMTPREISSKALAYLASVGMADKKDHFPSRMTGGEQQRVAAARAFAKEPQLLLCDEPTGELSTREGTQVLSVIQKMVKGNPDLLAVLVTHNQKIAQIGDMVIRLRSGEVDTIKFQEPVVAETISW